MQITDLVKEMDHMVSQGQIVQAVEKFFSPKAATLDFDGTKTGTKADMIGKMTGFVNAIEKVNGITLHHATNNDHVSMSEYTFDFNMKDGSKILWHEIIRREWENGMVVNEQYFKN